MISIYKLFSKILKFIINILFVVQIALMITVFLTATYWFLDLINVNAFDFVKPLAELITSFMRLFYKQDVNIGGVFLDGSLLLFDIMAIALVVALAKFKYHIIRTIDSLNILIRECQDKQEIEFNKSLQKEVEKKVKKSNNVAILIQFKAQNMLVDSCWGGKDENEIKEKEEEAFKIFYASIKNLEGCKFAKTDNKMLILSENFDNIDHILNYIELVINRIRINMKKKKWLLISLVATDVYEDKSAFKTEIYPMLEKLLALNIKNEPVCLSSFCMRYELISQSMFKPFLRGKYNFGTECNVWSLVKKV